MNIATAYVELRIDRKQAEKDAKDSANGVLKSITDIFKAGVLIKGLQESIKQASDLNETVSKSKVIFGDSGKAIEGWSKDSAKNLGLSQRAALDAASAFAVLGKGAGLTGDNLTDFSEKLVGLASDLTSFYDTDPQQAVDAINSALIGESEPIRQFGVLLNETTIKQRAMTLGLYDGVGALDQHARVLATQAEILAQTSDAQGDFARTAGSAANMQRSASAAAEDSAASFGQVLLPVYKRVLDVVTFLVAGFGALPAPIQTVVVALSALLFLSGPIGKVKDVVIDLAQAFVNAGVSAGTLAAAAAGAGTVIAAAAILYTTYNARKKEAEQRTRDLSDALHEESKAQNEALAALAANDPATRSFLQTLKDLGLSTADVAQYMQDGTGPAAALGAAYGEAAAKSKDGFIAGGDLADAIGDVTDTTGLSTEALGSFAFQLDALRQGELDRIATQGLVNEVTKEATVVTEANTAATGLSAEAQRLAGEAALYQSTAAAAATRESDRLSAAFKRNTSAADTELQSLRDLYDEMLSQVDTQRAYERSVDDSDQALADYVDTLKHHKTSSEEATDAARDTADQLIGTAKAYAAAQGATDGSKTSIDLMIQSLYDQAVKLSAGDPLRQNLLDYIGELQKIPATIDTEIRLNVTGKTVTSDGRIVGLGTPTTGKVVRSAAGRYVAANSNLLTTVAEPGVGPEVILPLNDASRMRLLLSDSRVGRPVLQALDPYGFSQAQLYGHSSQLSLSKPPALQQIVNLTYGIRTGDPLETNDVAPALSTRATSPLSGGSSTIYVVIEGTPFKAILEEHDKELFYDIAAGARQ